MSDDKLCRTFQRLSSRTWRDVRDGAKIRLSEETITDNLLLYLTRQHPTDIHIRKFTKWEEGRETGADWEWWFVRGSDGLPLRIQAKRIDVTSQDYPELQKDYVKSNAQVDLLLRAAKKRNFYPMYCLYNYWPAGQRPSSWPCKGKGYRDELLGCAIASAIQVKNLISKRTTTTAHLSSIWRTWHCLVCCDGTHNSPPAGLPSRTRRFISQNFGEELLPEVGPIPRYVNQILHGETPHFEEGYNSEDGPRGIVVVTERQG